MQSEDLIGQTLGHYKVKRQIGYGGMATVFLAEDIHLGREIALKVFWPRPGETQDFLRRFTREARVLAQLDHPHILPVYDYGEQGELAFLVVPYMSGGSLKEVLRQRKVLPPSEAVQLISQVLPALQYAHDRNLIHRDIKPGNLLFKGDGNMVLADFGLVKVVQGEDREGIPLHTLTESGQSIAGTPEYMSPEQIEGHAGPSSDIYSLGVVFYEMLTGVRPFVSNNLLSILLKHANETPRAPRELNPYISPQLEAVLLKALEKEPRQRFAHPRDFLQALQHASDPISQAGLIEAVRPDAASRVGTHKQESGYTTIEVDWQAEQPESRPSSAGATPSRSAQPAPPSSYGQAANPGAGQPPVQNWSPAGGAGNPYQQSPVPPVQAVPPIYQGQTWGSRASNPGLPQGQAWGNQAQTMAPQALPGHRRPSRLPLVVLVLLCLLLVGFVVSLFITPLGTKLLLGSAGHKTPATGHPGVSYTPITRGGDVPTPAATTAPLGQTQTSCPADGSARPAVMAHLALGSDPSIVYLVNEQDASGHPTYGTVKIFDTVNGQKRELSKTSATKVLEAQVSNDGQWVLFATQINGISELRIVRLDGQGLQTLFCAPTSATLRGSQWSIDQRYIIFDVVPVDGSEPTVYLLNTQSGALQAEVTPPVSGYALMARTWLDDTHVLMTGVTFSGDHPQTGIYILDLSKGEQQPTSSITPFFTSTTLPCWDFDSSYDGLSLFVTQCTQSGTNASSTISQLPLNGSAAHLVLSSPTIGFSTIRVIDKLSATLLAIGGTTSNGQTTEGLYVINTDGSGSPLPLTEIDINAGSLSLNQFSQYFWANVSRDHGTYALTRVSNNEYSIEYGSINGGTPITFVNYNQYMAVAGWTVQ